MRGKERHRLAWAGAIVLALVAATGIPAAAAAGDNGGGNGGQGQAEERVEKSTTVEPGTNGDEEGYWVTVKETVFVWEIQDYIEVVAYYRAYRSSWLDELKSEKWGKANTWNHKASVNEDQVKDAVVRAGWKTCLQYCKEKIPYSWQNQGIMLINVETGEIIGHVGVGNSYDAVSKVMNWYDKEVNVELVGQGKQKVKLVACSVWASPIVLDLEGLGKPDLLAGPAWRLVPGRQVASSALRPFDLDGKGLYTWEWIGPRSGLLAWDADGSGRIRSGEQLFGNYTWGKRWRDGYQALATLDGNRDGVLRDEEFANLVVWVDASSDGVSDPGETHSLADLGITSINVRPRRDKAGNTHAPRGFVREVGGKSKTLATWDWISMGQAREAEGVYVWVGKDGDRPLGGYLRLHEQAGEIRGYAVPTIGGSAIPGKVVPAFPITGRRVGETIRWSLPSPDGPVLSEVRWDAGGKHLYGMTRADTKTARTEYLWQAELIAGEPIGGGASEPAVARK